MKKWVCGGVLILSAAVLSSCVKDKDIDDYKREKAQKELAQFQAIEGRYSGLIKSERDGKILGGFQLTLTAELKTDTPSDGSVAVGSPKLVTELQFYDFSGFSIQTDQSIYNPDNGVYEADFQIPTKQVNLSVKFSVYGQISNGHILGRLEGGDNAIKADFELDADGPRVIDLADKRETKNWEKATISFESKQMIGTGDVGAEPGDIVLTAGFSKTMTDAAHFANVFLNNQKFLRVEWVLNKNVYVVFDADNAAWWDQDTGELVGSAPSIFANGLVQQIYCEDFHFVDKKAAFNCDFSSNRSDTITSTFQLCKKPGCK